jgi:hypothetical protein
MCKTEKLSLAFSSVSLSPRRGISYPHPLAWKKLSSDPDLYESYAHVSHLFPDVLAFPYSTH